MEQEALTPNALLIGERNYEAAILRVLSEGKQRICIFDPDLSKGAWLSLSIYECLNAFFVSSSSSQIQWVLHNSTYYEQHGARLKSLFITYNHRMQMYVTDARVHHVQDPLLVVDGAHTLHRFHIQHARFKFILNDPVAARPLQERFDELLESAPTQLSPTTLGL